MAESKAIDNKCINTIRCLCADTVRKANSGHPGMPLGMAPAAHVLWSKHLKFNPNNPKWIARDRFVLSNGHGCTLLYSMLHLCGYNVKMDDLKRFRQLGSITPGHPENHLTDGIEVTTGPLGQGIANAVGLAAAEAHLASVYNRDDFNIFNNHVYVFCGDGCLQEGISGEAASLAGHLKLGKLIIIYDDNKITIDGETSKSFSEDVPKRFEGYGWHTITIEDGNNDIDAINNAIEAAKAVTDKPSIISLKTTIGFGSLIENTHSVHGSPMSPDDIKQLKEKFGFDSSKFFQIDDDVYDEYSKLKSKGKQLEDDWIKVFNNYAEKYPNEANEIKRRFANELPKDWETNLPKYQPSDKANATRGLSGDVLNALAPLMPELVGGSADLTPSTKTELKCSNDFSSSNYNGRYFRFGVREHGMCAMANGLYAYGGLLPFTATFLNFIEYAFPAVRLAALSHLQQILVMTHDSIGLGEDGPTHQPIEALALCRATPGVYTFRPADGNETSGAYLQAIKYRNGPSVIALTRQNVPQLDGSAIDNVAKGGYVLCDSKDNADLILISTGSEVSITLEAASLLSDAGRNVRVVSMPCWELFDQQNDEYRSSVITPGVLTISIEAASVTGWERYAHHSIGMKSFGASAPYELLYDHFGLSKDKIAQSVLIFAKQFEEKTKKYGLNSKPSLLPVHF